MFTVGEGVALVVAGQLLSAPVNANLCVEELEDKNIGAHSIHTGGKFDSRLVLPVVLAGERTYGKARGNQIDALKA